jgi:DNA-binding XRE family transcriptional regulator
MKNHLRVIRAEKRVTQWQLRLMTGINQSKISMAENDLVELRPEEKNKIAKALGVSIGDIWKVEARNNRTVAG